MLSKKIIVSNASGLHARPASMFVTAAQKYKSNVTVRKGEESCNGKSIISIIASGITSGTEIEVLTDGPDELQAMNDLITLIESKFGE